MGPWTRRDSRLSRVRCRLLPMAMRRTLGRPWWLLGWNIRLTQNMGVFGFAVRALKWTNPRELSGRLRCAAVITCRHVYWSMSCIYLWTTKRHHYQHNTTKFCTASTSTKLLESLLLTKISFQVTETAELRSITCTQSYRVQKLPGVAGAMEKNNSRQSTPRYQREWDWWSYWRDSPTSLTETRWRQQRPARRTLTPTPKQNKATDTQMIMDDALRVHTRSTANASFHRLRGESGAAVALLDQMWFCGSSSWVFILRDWILEPKVPAMPQ